MIRMDNIKKRLILLGIIMLTAVVFSGCGGAYGRLRASPEITQTFLHKQMLPGYNYYYDGRQAIPYAVVGIKDDYVFTSKFWTPIKQGSSQFDRLLDWLYGSDIWDPYGAEILDPEGNPVGIWFSAYTYTRIEFGPEKQVNVFSPYIPSRNSIL